MKAFVSISIGALLLLTAPFMVGAESGFVIYTTIDKGSDDIAKAVPFVKAERFPLVTNVTTRDGKILRITNNQLKEIVYPPDLTRATIVDDAGIETLRKKSEGIRALQERFPRAREVLDSLVNEVDRTIQVLESGNVLHAGRLMSRADYQNQMASSGPKTIDLTVGGKSYKGAKLSSVRADVASIMHSGGGASVSIDQLSDEQILQLNATSKMASINREAIKKQLVEAAKPEKVSQGSQSPSDKLRVSTIGAMPDIDTVADLLHRKQREAAQRLAQKGRQLQVFSARDIATRTTEGAAKFMAYDVGALVASNVIDNFGDASGKSRHRELMSELGREPDQHKAEAIKRRMLNHAQRYFTGDINSLHAEGASTHGREMMMRTMSKTMIRALTHVAFQQETRSRQSVQVSYQREMAGITALSEDEMLDFQTKFDLPTRMDIAEALQTEKWDQVDLSILGDKPTQGAYIQHLATANHRSSGVLGRQLDIYITRAAADPTLSNTFSEMDEREYYRGVLPRLIEQTKRGSRGTAIK